MNIEQAIKQIQVCYKINRPFLMLSSPGVGKSSSVYQAASQMSELYRTVFGVIEVRAATSNPAELADLKAVIDGKVVDLAQDWVPTKEKVERGECPERGLIFLDEIADGTATTQSALQQLLLDRRLGSARLAPGWGTVAASNRAGDKAAAGRLSTALVNRCITVTVEPDTDVFCRYAMANDFAYEVPAFCRWRPSPWDFNPAAKNLNPAFCSPRSMHILSDLLKEDPNPDPEMINGIIGDGVGSEFFGFLKLKDELPSIQQILSDPESVKVPKSTDVAIATIYALMARMDDKNSGNALRWFGRNKIEIATMAFKDVITTNRNLGQHPVVIEWMTQPENYKALTFDFS